MNRLTVCLLLLVGLAGASSLAGRAMSAAAPDASAAQDWLAWTMAPDGTLFALDAHRVLHRLSPLDLSSQAHSQPLPLTQTAAPVYLAAEDTYLFVGSGAISQTLVLRRSDFGQVARLDDFGPMAVDPGHQLFMIPQQAAFKPYHSGVWVVALARLDQTPQVIDLDCVSAQGLSLDTVGRQLYVRTHSSCASPPHQGEAYKIYDLDTLKLSGESEPQLGQLSPLAVASRVGRLFVTLDAYNTNLQLFILDRQGQPLSTRPGLGLGLNGRPAVDAGGSWLYLLRKRGLWVLSGTDLSLHSLLPFTRTSPSEVILSPDGASLYLLGNHWQSVVATDQLQRLGLGSFDSIPANWFSTDWVDYAQPRLYPSPQIERDGRLFVQVVSSVGVAQETYRSLDNGRSWRLLTDLIYPSPLLAAVTYPESRYVMGLSLSPDFAADRTLVALSWSHFLRSSDAGDSWQLFGPPLAFVSEQDGNREIYRLDGGERLHRLTTNPAADENPAWSPAWTRLAFQSQRSGNWDIFSLRADCMAPAEIGCDLRQLTDSPADDTLPAWSPDGRQIAFVSTRDGNPELYVMAADGQHPRRLTFNPGGDWRPAWLPDSRHLVFTSDPAGNNDIYQLTVPAPGEPAPIAELDLTPIVTGPADDRDPAFTDNAELLFLSDRDGVMKTYIMGMRYSHEQPRAFTATDQPEAHPTWQQTGAGLMIVVETSRAGRAGIYGATYGSQAADYLPLVISKKGFDGHPAWMASGWAPDESASLAWLQAHQD